MTDISVGGGTRISYHDGGSGAPILFLHSFGHNKNLWYPQLMHFSRQEYRVLAPDLPGHGESSFVPDQHTVDGIARLYVELLDRLELSGIVLAGISIGGYIALRMWARRPDLISAMVLCCSKAEADTPEIKARRTTQIAALREHGLEKFIETGAPKRVSPYTANNKPWVVEWLKMMNRTVSAEANAATLEAMALKEDDTATLQTIDVPALILSGSDDVFIPPESPGNLHSGIRDSVHHVIRKAGHVASLEAPQEVNGHLDDFLASIRLRGRDTA